MREKISYLASWIIVIVTFVRFSVEAVFLPLVAVPGSREWTLEFAPIFIMVVAAALSFTRQRLLSVVLASFAFVWICTQLLSAGWVWVFSSTGFWGIAPSACLAVATTAKWLALRTRSTELVSQNLPE